MHYPREFVLDGTYELDIAGDRIPARASLKQFIDPEGRRVKA